MDGLPQPTSPTQDTVYWSVWFNVTSPTGSSGAPTLQATWNRKVGNDSAFGMVYVICKPAKYRALNEALYVEGGPADGAEGMAAYRAALEK